jgi:hypothetical protein
MVLSLDYNKNVEEENLVHIALFPSSLKSKLIDKGSDFHCQT